MDIKRAILWPDTHIGLDLDGVLSHDEKAVQLLLNVIKDIKPDYIYLLGDFADFYCVSSHGKDPSVRSLLKDELYLVHTYLKKIVDAAPNAERHFIEGNHSYRMARYIAKACPDLFGTIELSDILKLSEYGFKHHKYGPNQLVQVGQSKLYARHEPLARNPELAVRKSLVSVVNGHDHTIKRAKATSMNGECYESISCGWLGNRDCPIFNYVQSVPNWQLGFGIATILPDGNYFFEQIEIKNNMALVDGVLYSL